MYEVDPSCPLAHTGPPMVDWSASTTALGTWAPYTTSEPARPVNTLDFLPPHLDTVPPSEEEVVVDNGPRHDDGDDGPHDDDEADMLNLLPHPEEEDKR
jgi:hypothetical protein